MKAHLFEFLESRGSFNLKNDLPRLMRGMGEQLIQRAPDYELNQSVSLQLSNWAGMHPASVSQDSNPICDSKNLFEPVRNVHDPDASGFEFANNCPETYRFLFGQRRGGLIHDDHLRLPEQCSRDGNQLRIRC